VYDFIVLNEILEVDFTFNSIFQVGHTFSQRRE